MSITIEYLKHIESIRETVTDPEKADSISIRKKRTKHTVYPLRKTIYRDTQRNQDKLEFNTLHEMYCYLEEAELGTDITNRVMADIVVILRTEQERRTARLEDEITALPAAVKVLLRQHGPNVPKRG